MAIIDIKDSVIRVKDGSNPITKTVDVKVGEGNLTYTETRTRDYIQDRGIIDTVRDGDEEVLQLSFDLQWIEITGSEGGLATVEDALKKRELASAFESTDDDACNPFALDIELELDANCADKDREYITFPQFRYETVNHDLRAGTIAVAGNCNVVEPLVEHSRSPKLAAAFEAANVEYLSSADNAAFPTGANASFSAWIRTPEAADMSGTKGLVTKWEEGTATEWALYLEDKKLRFAVNTTSPEAINTNYIESNTELEPETWYHVLLEYDGAGVGNALRLQMYLDSVLEASAIYGGTIPAVIADTAAEVRIGSFDGTLETTGAFNGRVAMVGIWSTQVGSTVRTSVFRDGLGREYADLTAADKVSLAVWWDLGEANGSRADSHTNNLTLADNATVLSSDGVRKVVAGISS